MLNLLLYRTKGEKLTSLDMHDLLGALMVADAACSIDAAWDAIWDKLKESRPDGAPDSAELRAQLHKAVRSTVESLTVSMIQAQLGNPGIPMGPGMRLPQRRPVADLPPDPNTGMYL